MLYGNVYHFENINYAKKYYWPTTNFIYKYMNISLCKININNQTEESY